MPVRSLLEHGLHQFLAIEKLLVDLLEAIIQFELTLHNLGIATCMV
jgi:hypothetical protein